MKKRSKTSAERWNVPDWRKLELYPTPLPESDESDLLHWKWQFLRRNEEYRDDWHRFLALDHPFQLALNKDPRDDRFDSPRYPPKHPSRHADVWEVLKKYKLARLLNPSIDKPRRLRFYPAPGEGISVCFDLQRPLRDQMKRTEARLKARLKTLTRDRLPWKTNWAKYLRVLDACGEGVDHDIIGYEILGVNERKRPEIARSNTESALKSATTMWQRIRVKSWPRGGRTPAAEIDFDDCFPPCSPCPSISIYR